MTSLAAQLQAVASAVPREEKLKGKASLLYDIREAADIDLATIYAVGVQGASPRPPAGEALPPPPLYARRHIPRMARSTRRRRRSRREPVLARRRALDVPWHARARAASLERPGARSRARCPDASRTASVSPCRVSSSLTRRAPNKNKRLLRERRREFQSRARFVYTAGFTELCRSDGRFEAYQKPLFSRGASETNRELQDKAFNDRLNVTIEGFLRLLSGRFATAAAARCLEYLIRRFKIHVYNVEAAVTCALPYHATAEFVKLVQLANLENTSFYWLKGVKEKGAAPPRDGLVARCARDGAFLSFVCEAAAASASAKVPYRTACFFPFVFVSFSSSFVFGGCRHTEPPNDSPNDDDLRFVFSFFSKTFSSARRVARPVHRLFFRLMRGRTRALKPHASLRPAARWKSTLRDEKACRRPVPRSQRTAQTVMDGGA